MIEDKCNERNERSENIDVGNDISYKKLQFPVKMLADMQLLLVVNKHENFNCMYLVLSRVMLFGAAHKLS